MSCVVIRLRKLKYESPPDAVKSFVPRRYVEAAVRSTGAPVHVPSAACRTALITRVPAPDVGTCAAGGAGMIGVPWTSNVKHSPETCPNRPLAVFGRDETAISR